MKNCVICGVQGGCQTVAQAAKCSKNKLKSIVILIALSLALLQSCAQPSTPQQVPEKFTGLTEDVAVEIVTEGTKQGKEYIITKTGEGESATFEVVQINYRPR